jgi:hypothetical protein
MKKFKVYTPCGKILFVLAEHFQINAKNTFILFVTNGKTVAQFPPTASVIEINSILND